MRDDKVDEVISWAILSSIGERGQKRKSLFDFDESRPFDLRQGNPLQALFKIYLANDLRSIFGHKVQRLRTIYRPTGTVSIGGGENVSQFEVSKGNANHPLIPVAAPVCGVVIEKTVPQGEMVSPEKALFTVADLSTLWVIIDIYEKDMSRLRPGTGVKVSVTAFPDKAFRGKISYISDVVDEKTRTERARVTIDNSSGLLKPGMFATVLIEATGGETERLIAVPEEAVFIDGTKKYVFIQTTPDKFKMTEIEAGRTFGNRLEVTSGLKEGEMVAVRGAFILKSELKKGELVAEHGHGK